MTQRQYLSDVSTFIQSLHNARSSHNADIWTNLIIRRIGDTGTTLEGQVQARGYLLQVGIERFNFATNALMPEAFRYRIFTPGWTDPRIDQALIRLQTDKRGKPINAHFPPNYMTAHFTIDRWPAWLKPPTFFTAYKLFTMIVKTGALPEPFASA